MDDVNRALRSRNFKPSSSSSSSQPVASVTNSSLAPSASITEVNDFDTHFVASMFGPLSGSSIIGDASFSDGDASVGPHFKSKHFIWNCLIDGPA
jgi:hypothetical protein